jgi:hypothetical protein
MASTTPGTAVPSDPKDIYFAWRTTVLKRANAPDLSYEVELLVREAWSKAYGLGKRDGFLTSARLRGAIDVIEDFTHEMRDWQTEFDAFDVLAEDEVTA